MDSNLLEEPRTPSPPPPGADASAAAHMRRRWSPTWCGHPVSALASMEAVPESSSDGDSCPPSQPLPPSADDEAEASNRSADSADSVSTAAPVDQPLLKPPSPAGEGGDEGARQQTHTDAAATWHHRLRDSALAFFLCGKLPWAPR
jgi:hypothetical protein